MKLLHIKIISKMKQDLYAVHIYWKLMSLFGQITSENV